MLTTSHPQVVLNKLNGEWKMSLDGGYPKGPKDYPVIKVNAHDEGDFTFTITKASGTTFSSDPIWIQKGTTKPGQHLVDGQITDVHVSDQGPQKGLILTFHDTNADVGKLAYLLNFTDGSKLDPIIDNGGHPAAGTQYASSTSLTLSYVNLGLMLVAALIIGLALGRLIRR